MRGTIGPTSFFGTNRKPLRPSTLRETSGGLSGNYTSGFGYRTVEAHSGGSGVVSGTEVIAGITLGGKKNPVLGFTKLCIRPASPKLYKLGCQSGRCLPGNYTVIITQTRVRGSCGPPSQGWGRAGDLVIQVADPVLSIQYSVFSFSVR